MTLLAGTQLVLFIEKLYSDELPEIRGQLTIDISAAKEAINQLKVGSGFEVRFISTGSAWRSSFTFGTPGTGKTPSTNRVNRVFAARSRRRKKARCFKSAWY